jgi:hypothetical protein
MLAVYGTLPSYRGMLDREGLEGPADLALLGTEDQVGEALDRIASTGTSDLIAAIAPLEDGCRERTLDFLASWRSQ